MVIQLQQGCCCSLKSATIFIGVLGIVSSVLVGIRAVADFEHRGVESTPVLETFTGNTDDGKHNETLGRIIKVIMCLVEIAISAVLVAGAVQDRPKLVYPWIVVSVVQNSLTVIVLLTMAIYVTVIGNWQIGLFLIVTLAIYSLILGYMILVVNSYHTSILSPPSYDSTIKKELMMNV